MLGDKGVGKSLENVEIQAVFILYESFTKRGQVDEYVTIVEDLLEDHRYLV